MDPCRASHQAISRPTQCDPAASGEMSRTIQADAESASSIELQRPGEAVRFVSSRNSRTARSRFHGLANRSTSRCSRRAKAASPAWL